jgi:hypothetical protein
MAESTKREEAAKVSQTAVEAPGGVEQEQVKGTEDMSTSELHSVMTHDPDKKLHPKRASELEPSDQTPIPGPEYPPQERPPVSTARPDVPVLRSLVIGAGAHTPPDRDVFDADGRLKKLPGE